MRSSLRGKVLAALLVATLVPVAVAVALLVGVNREAVAASERQLQAAALYEVSRAAALAVRGAQADADAVAVALAEASRADDGGKGEQNGRHAAPEPLAAVRALLATRRSIDAARFEVPDAGVSTVLRREGASPSAETPASTPALRKAADERGVGLAVVGPTRAALAVPIPKVAPGAPAGYVTVAVDLVPMAAELQAIAQRFGSEVRLLVVDTDRRVVVSAGAPDALPGSDASADPVWSGLPAGTPWDRPLTVVSEHSAGGERRVGAVQFVPELGWAVAIARPEHVAYAVLDTMRTRGFVVALVATALAAAAGAVGARTLARPILALAEQARRIGARRWRDVELDTSRRDEIGELATSLAKMAEDLEVGEAEVERQARLRADLSRFLSRDLVEAIVVGEHPLELGGRRASVTVLFADVVAFTPLAESRPAEQVVALLNELFGLLTEIVFRHGGMVDKFVGDCVMAVWGAPVPQADHAVRALAAAEDMMRFLETASEGWRAKYDVELRIGVGVNSGEAIVGNIGSEKRMEYTVVGDVVNVAARLEAMAAPNQVLVGEGTRRAAGDRFALTSLGEKNLTGRKAASTVYALEVG